MQETGSSAAECISVQVALSGYVYRITSDGVSASSGWMSADRFFTDPVFQKVYGEVGISLFTPKFTLVPEHFFDRLAARQILSDVYPVGDSDYVVWEPLPELKAVLVYSNSIGETLSRMMSETLMTVGGGKAKVLPEAYHMLKSLSLIAEYNKVIASFADGCLYLVIAQGGTLLLCNSFEAADFVTAEYFILLSMKKLQLNPEMTVVFFRTPLSEEQEMSLYRYFKSVDYI